MMIFTGKPTHDLPSHIQPAFFKMMETFASAEETRVSLAALGEYLAERFAVPGDGAVVVMGTAPDFDEFTMPVVDRLKQNTSVHDVKIHCLWPSLDLGGGLKSEYRQKASAVETVVLTTVSATNIELIEMMVARAKELYDPASIVLVAALVSDEVSRFVSNAAIVSMLALWVNPEFVSRVADIYYKPLHRKLMNEDLRGGYMPKSIKGLLFKR